MYAAPEAGKSGVTPRPASAQTLNWRNRATAARRTSAVTAPDNASKREGWAAPARKVVGLFSRGKFYFSLDWRLAFGHNDAHFPLGHRLHFSEQEPVQPLGLRPLAGCWFHQANQNHGSPS
jgi:hypothetical protein